MMDDASPDTNPDVIIVGAGAAGLAAAYVLGSARDESGTPVFKVLVLESGKEPGGRVLTDPKYSGIDYGAAYLGPLQSYTMRFCDLLGVDTIPNDLDVNFYHRIQWSERPAIFKYCGASFAVPEAKRGPLLGSLGLLSGFIGDRNAPETSSNYDVLRAEIAKLEALVLALRGNLHDPWRSPEWAGLDQLSVEDYVRTRVAPNDYVRDLLRVGVRAALSAEPEEVSMLYVLYYCATGGSFVNVMAVGGGADTFRFKGGATRFIEALAVAATGAPFEPPRRNVTIQCDSPVTEVEEQGDVVTVCAGGKQYQAKRCIIAMSPVLRSRQWIPDLPEEQQGLADATKWGRTIKAFGVFDEPWWRKSRGASGYILSAKNDPENPIVWTMHNSYATETTTVNSLMAFIVGARADELEKLSPDDRKKAVFKHWETLFEMPSGSIQGQYLDSLSARGTTACPAAFFKPGKFLENFGLLAKPLGRIHWAGAETATDWVGGYINGALQSGVRAANEIACELTQGLPTLA